MGIRKCDIVAARGLRPEAEVDSNDWGGRKLIEKNTVEPSGASRQAGR